MPKDYPHSNPQMGDIVRNKKSGDYYRVVANSRAFDGRGHRTVVVLSYKTGSYTTRPSDDYWAVGPDPYAKYEKAEPAMEKLQADRLRYMEALRDIAQLIRANADPFAKGRSADDMIKQITTIIPRDVVALSSHNPTEGQ